VNNATLNLEIVAVEEKLAAQGRKAEIEIALR
jgi:hypothetical protein